jgi:hypothetical protein
MFLATIPGADQAQRLARRLADAVIAHPGPWPATARGRAFVHGCVPPRHQALLPPVLPLPPPLLLGQGPQDAGGQVLVPGAHPGQFVVGAAAKDGGEHQPKALAQPFPPRLQSPLDLLRHRRGHAHIDQGLFQRLQVALCASVLALEMLAVLLKAAVLRVVLSSVGACHGGHGLLRLLGVRWVGRKPWRQVQVISRVFRGRLLNSPY